jgi:ribosomal protein S18 acetylase RimI-like enzyme
MTPEEYAGFRADTCVEYAAQKVEAGEYPAGEGEERALAEINGLLPDGAGTEGMLLLVGEVDGVVVGRAWVGLQHPQSPPGTAWIYAIEVSPEHRGKGYSKALLAGTERETARHGVPYLGLNVFGPNAVARHLYESSGYETQAVQMRKKL